MRYYIYTYGYYESVSREEWMKYLKDLKERGFKKKYIKKILKKTIF